MNIRLFNIPTLILLAVCMFAFRYGFLTQQNGFAPALNEWQYALLVLAGVLVAAGGFLMNNAFSAGRENNTGISEATGYNIYIALNIVAVGIAYYLSNLFDKPMYAGIFVVASASLYLYATSLKQSLLVSNIIMAVVCTLPLVAIGVFNIYFALNEVTIGTARPIFLILLDYIVFTFVINLILTFVNDLANSDADYNAGLNTLPILLGRARTQKIILALSIIPAAMLLYYGQEYLINLPYALGFVLLFVGGPLAYMLIKLWNARTSGDFKHIEGVLKLVVLFTALSIGVITFNIKLKQDAKEQTEKPQADTGVGLAPQAAVFEGA